MIPKRGLVIKKKFDAAHFLSNYQGACAKVHGHTYYLDLYLNFKAHPLNELGMLIDFKEIDRIIEEVIKRYDHTLLNSIEPYGHEKSNEETNGIVGCVQDLYQTLNNPTAEFMSEVMFKEINRELQTNLNLSYNVLEKIVVWETDKHAASFELE